MDASNQSANISQFVVDPYVRSSWIAFFTLWVLWGLSYFIRHAFVRDHQKPVTVTEEDPEAAAGGVEKKKRWNNFHTSLSDRLANSHEVLKENTLLLLSVLVLNTFGSASTRAVFILSWIFFAFTVLHAVTEIGVSHHFVRLFFNIIFYGVTLAIGGLAFHYGWKTSGSVF